MTEWRSVVGFPDYQVSDDGEIRATGELAHVFNLYQQAEADGFTAEPTDAWALCTRPVDQVDLVSTGVDGDTIAAAWTTTEPGVVFYDFVNVEEATGE